MLPAKKYPDCYISAAAASRTPPAPDASVAPRSRRTAVVRALRRSRRCWVWRRPGQRDPHGGRAELRFLR